MRPLVVMVLALGTLSPAMSSATRAAQDHGAPAAVQVNVNSTPAGATVSLDDEQSPPLGNTPLRHVRIPRGPHRLFFRHDGYVPAHLDVVMARRDETFTTTLVQAGSVYVSGNLDGARVLIDGVVSGVTPARIDAVTPGPHVIEVRPASGSAAPYRETVTVTAGALAQVTATFALPDAGVDSGVPEATGRLDPLVFQYVYNRFRSQIATCYAGLSPDGRGSGTMRVAVRVGGGGQVVATRVVSNETHNRALEACVQQRVRSWTFPSPQGGDVEFEYSFAFGH